MTKSEQVFAEYCRTRGYEFSAIPTAANSRRTADFRIRVSGSEVLIEIKEITANDEDRVRQRDHLAGRIVVWGDTIGRRARLQIKGAAEQLRAYKDDKLPSVVVLYDNVVVDGRQRPFRYSDLESFHIDAAMYGFTQANLILGPTGVVAKNPDSAGGGRITTEKERNYISAVSVLYDLRELRMVTYHNYYASNPLPSCVFSTHGDMQFRKPACPDTCPGVWEQS